jgi:hypothetical protein
MYKINARNVPRFYQGNQIIQHDYYFKSDRSSECFIRWRMKQREFGKTPSCEGLQNARWSQTQGRRRVEGSST